MSAPRRDRAAAGFSLLELVMVMALMGVLAAIAVPMYTQYVQRAARSEARTALLEVAQWAQRYRTDRGSFAGADAALPAALREVRDGGATLYTIALASTTDTFTATATPGGRMANDPCAALSVDHTGARRQTGASASANVCWGR
jgi:type IV pilus assembly protein PilE